MAGIVILDDNGIFVDTVTARLKTEGIVAQGYKSFETFARDARAGGLRDVHLMFVDMNLGPRPGGGIITAVDVVPVAKTYAPAAKIVIFTHQGISLQDCIDCVRLGALGLVPKSDDLGDLLIAAQVYPHIGDAERVAEALVKELWLRLQDAGIREKGGLFEMLLANLLPTMSEGIRFVGNNWSNRDGEIDLIFENTVDMPFWNELKSLNLIVECKNRAKPPESSDFAIFKAKVKGKGGCRVGILASWERRSRGIRNLQQPQDEEAIIFTLDGKGLRDLINVPASERLELLTHIFRPQR